MSLITEQKPVLPPVAQADALAELETSDLLTGTKRTELLRFAYSLPDQQNQCDRLAISIIVPAHAPQQI